MNKAINSGSKNVFIVTLLFSIVYKIIDKLIFCSITYFQHLNYPTEIQSLHNKHFLVTYPSSFQDRDCYYFYPYIIYPFFSVNDVYHGTCFPII